ncbi:MAG: type II toxin-antitoxin system VapC family toxin [Ignavibacteriota bacterium]|jgi:predicted nucleic acid-binding protein|nr:MAG: type II toxin-antitoxin system VapC family toxin [Chlorobiota bacterium]MBE7477358.1 type II toxin-antitoxin system VapC family toxin [Ignavibacteriales bacterium]MBL1122759.1 type II toxin-antitoxin system VapC family toxin [Ignavibacteriota bacterium]MCE7857596.1 type II toxin-antitoxin system VapC family toxin [Ignavibacteria bacterium CHB3]NUM63127.1 type II toxin-antitoxin system VapC family toxin [Ignavibacteriaceae bacterium]
MNLVDSSAWMEYFAGGKNAKHFAPIIQDLKNLVVSVINIYEVYKKISQHRDENSAIQAIAVMQQAEVLEITSQIAIEGSKISIQNKIPMADSLIIASARSVGAKIWTQDYDFKGLDNVMFFKK